MNKPRLLPMPVMRLHAVFTFALLSCVALQAGAQPAWPARNVQIIVPYTPGGSIDIMTRSVAQQLAIAWGKNVVVDNRPGASGMIGTEIATKAEPDGYVLLGHTSSYPATAAVREKLPFDPARAIVPVAGSSVLGATWSAMYCTMTAPSVSSWPSSSSMMVSAW